MAAVYSFLHAHNFATLVTCSSEGAPFATHIPMLFNAEENVLRAHIARANPQWKHFSSEREVLTIFSGAHTYVSSLWYDDPQNVSTWNYTAVHIYGIPRIIEDAAFLYKLLLETNRIFDGDAGVQHFEQLDTRFREGLTRGIVGFEIDIRRIEAKFKLSQNRDDADRRSVIQHLEQERSDENSHAIAAMMREMDSKE